LTNSDSCIILCSCSSNIWIAKLSIIQEVIFVKREGKVINEFGKKVKIALIERGLSQKSLAEAVSADTGLKVDEAYLSNILAGSRTPPRVIVSIKRLLDLDEETDKTA
jgi:hypothetical protein